MAKEDGIGRYVTAVSGEQVIAKVSGETIVSKISGEEIISRISGQRVISKISGETIVAQISGQLVAISGDILSRISGQTVYALISGQPVMVSGIVALSPAKVEVSGTIISKVSGETIISKISGEAVKISGEKVDIIAPTTIRTRAILIPSSASGGTALASGVVVSVTIKSLSGDVYVGGSTEPPYSGYGFLLAAGEAISLDISNLNAVRVCSNVSGGWCTYVGVN